MIIQTQLQIDEIARTHGLSAALAAAWNHGITSGYIPAALYDEDPEVSIPPTTSCPYRFVHVPGRRIRGDAAALTARNIMNPDPDPESLVYHEEGIIDSRTFTGGPFATLRASEVEGLLDALTSAGLLIRVQTHDQRIRYVEHGSIERWYPEGQRVFVRNIHQPVTPTAAAALRDTFGSGDSALIGAVVGALQRRSPCFYCSVGTLFPREVTVSTRGLPEARRPALSRDYQLGFTFAPIGQPGEVRHILAWDDSGPGTRTQNMDLHQRSFSDLIQLVQIMGRDLTPFDSHSAVALSGICNHRAGNTMAHQHYQFFQIPAQPLEVAFDSAIAAGLEPLAVLDHIGIWAIGRGWPAPAYQLAPLGTPVEGREDAGETLLDAVGRVTRAWTTIREQDATQNLFASHRDGRVRAVFIPRSRERVDATYQGFTKRNAGALEMIGSFITDDPGKFNRIRQLNDDQRRAIGDSWLKKLAPNPEWVHTFEHELRSHLV